MKRTSLYARAALAALWCCALVGGALVSGEVHAQTPASADPGTTPPYQSSWEEFQALKAKAHGGARKTPAQLPDWTGLWTREIVGGIKMDFRQKRVDVTTAVLTPEYRKKFEQKLADYARGIEWDQLSYCLPAGYPRWLTEPFLREFVLRPEESWLINEQLNEIRRVYTDGRGHIPDDEAYPLWEGDSIGFWDGDTLVVHTNNLKPGEYNRRQPDYSAQTTTVEQWRRVTPDLIEDTVDIYDPASLAKPWRTVQRYLRVTTPDLRINYWSCEENNNVVKTPDGSTQFVLPGEPGYKDPNTLQDTLTQGPAKTGR
jgi:hypothetical protein